MRTVIRKLNLPRITSSADLPFELKTVEFRYAKTEAEKLRLGGFSKKSFRLNMFKRNSAGVY